MNRDMMTVAGAAAAGLAGDTAISRHSLIGLCTPCTSEKHPLSAGTGAGVSSIEILLCQR